MNSKISKATEDVSKYYGHTRARNIANSTVEMLIAMVGDNDSLRVNSATSINLMNGTASYTITDTTISSTDYIKIKVNASYFGETHNTEVLVTIPTNGTGFMPAAVQAAVTTNNPVKTLGTLQVDGREHDINGNLIGGSGTLAIWTTGTVSRSGNSKYASYSSGCTYPLAKSTANRSAASQVYSGGYPDTPDSILGGTANGFPPGTLKSYAQGGENGSQYVTNPVSLTYPLGGVTYVELSSGSIWNSANITGEGILIVHNSSTNAIIKNLNTGPFKGLLIADDIVHVHCDIIGAVIGLTPSPSDGNCIGNGSGRILYSSEAITGATALDDESINYGFGEKRINIDRWYE
ncbi:MAG: hypothetical protein PVH88_13400 [Ignavibacteria bacterium]